jgi:hypothetical protein
MPRYAPSFLCFRRGRIIAAYAKVRLIPQDSRALPAAFLRSRPVFATFKTFYEIVNFGNFIPIMILPKNNLCTTHSFDRVYVFESSSLVSPGTIGHLRGGSGDIFQWILCLQYAATAMRKKILHIAGHHLYNAEVGGFYRGVRAGEGSAGGILFFESKGIQSFF